MEKRIYIAPSILSADLLKLEQQVSQVIRNGADMIHVDVMDGHFVPNLTFGPNMVEALKKIVDIPLDVHLMIDNPDLYLKDYAKAGANILTVHQEASLDLHRTIQKIHQWGMKAGVAVNPATPVSLLSDIIEEVDLVLIMSVNPGFGGQSYIPYVNKKLKKAREMIDNSGRQIRLEIDGGVKIDNIGEIAAAGADTFVAGSAIFGADDYKATIDAMRAEIAKATG